MSHCDIREIIRAAAAVLAPSAAEKGITVRLQLPEPQLTWADADRIQEVITNLIGNGIKFCSRGGHIEVWLKRSETSGPGGLRGDYAQVDVRDDGPGIEAAAREHIFKRFYQCAGSGCDRSGSGLGLAISKEIVVHHRGEIWLDARAGNGSLFCFTIPLRPSDRPSAMASATAEA